MQENSSYLKNIKKRIGSVIRKCRLQKVALQSWWHHLLHPSRVSSSIRIITSSNHMFSTLLMQSPKMTGVWGSVKFKCHGKADLYVVVNESPYPMKSLISMKPIVLWIVEPPSYIVRLNYLSITNLEFYDKIIGPINMRDVPPQFHSKIIVSPPFVPWHLFLSAYQKTNAVKNFGYDHLMGLDRENKQKNIVCINSNISDIPGHLKRFNFISMLSGANLNFDLYGGNKHVHLPQYKGYFEDKYSLFRQYKFVLVFENEVADTYWSEKLTDALLSLCIPIYFGTHAVKEVFPDGSIIFADMGDVEIVRKINDWVSSSYYEDNLPALRQAKRIVMENENFLAKATALMSQVNSEIV